VRASTEVKSDCNGYSWWPLPDTVSKNVVSRRSLVVRKIIWILAQVLWLAICLAALMEAYKSYRGISDWQVEEGLGFEMMVLSFPASFVVVAGFMLTGMLLGLFGLALPASSKPEMIATFVFFVTAGYIQWFLVAPRIPKWWKNSQQSDIPRLDPIRSSHLILGTHRTGFVFGMAPKNPPSGCAIVPFCY
jgi:hypothetical protein